MPGAMLGFFFTPTKFNRGIPCQLMQRQGRHWAALSTLNPSLNALHAAFAACSSLSAKEYSHEITLLHEGSGAFKRSAPVWRWCQVGHGNAVTAESNEMRLKIECGELNTRAGYRPGMMIIEADEVSLLDFDGKQMLNQFDIKDVMEWLAEQGYTIHQEIAA